MFKDITKSIARFGSSIGEIPYNFKTGRPAPLKYPWGESYQQTAVKTADDVVAGKRPRRDALKPFYQAPMDAGMFLGATQGLKGSRALAREMTNIKDDISQVRNPIFNKYQWKDSYPLKDWYSPKGSRVPMHAQAPRPYFKEMNKAVRMPFNPESTTARAILQFLKKIKIA